MGYLTCALAQEHHQATVGNKTVGSGAVARETREEFFLENRRQRVVDICGKRLLPYSLERLRGVKRGMEKVREKAEHAFDLGLDLLTRPPGLHYEPHELSRFFRILSSETSLSSGAPYWMVVGLKQCTLGNTKSLDLSRPGIYSKETGIAAPH